MSLLLILLPSSVQVYVVTETIRTIPAGQSALFRASLYDTKHTLGKGRSTVPLYIFYLDSIETPLNNESAPWGLVYSRFIATTKYARPYKNKYVLSILPRAYSSKSDVLMPVHEYYTK